jgi:hypothetical protein
MGDYPCGGLTEPTGRTGEQNVIIITAAGLFDDPLVASGGAWITDVASRYVNNNFIEGLESDFPDQLTEGAVLLETDSVLRNASVNLAGFIASESRWQIQRQDYEYNKHAHDRNQLPQHS